MVQTELISTEAALYVARVHHTKSRLLAIPALPLLRLRALLPHTEAFSSELDRIAPSHRAACC
jgi:hypothetical protein